MGFIIHRVVKFVFNQEETEKLQKASKEIIHRYN